MASIDGVVPGGDAEAAAAHAQAQNQPEADPYAPKEGAPARQRVWFDITVDSNAIGRIVFELFNVGWVPTPGAVGRAWLAGLPEQGHASYPFGYQYD